MDSKDFFNEIDELVGNKSLKDDLSVYVQKMDAASKECEEKGNNLFSYINETKNYCENAANSDSNTDALNSFLVKPNITREDFLFGTDIEPKELYKKQLIALQQASQNLHVLDNEKKQIGKIKENLDLLKTEIEFSQSNFVKQKCESAASKILKEAKQGILEQVNENLIKTRKINKTIRTVLGIVSILSLFTILPLFLRVLTSLNSASGSNLLENAFYSNVDLNGFSIFFVPLCLLSFILNGIFSKVRLRLVRNNGTKKFEKLSILLRVKSKEIINLYKKNYLEKAEVEYNILKDRVEQVTNKKYKIYNEHYSLYKNIISAHYPPDIENLELLDKIIEIMLNGYATEYKDAKTKAQQSISISNF